MGVYLSDPKTDKESEDCSNKKFNVGVSGMQGNDLLDYPHAASSELKFPRLES